MNEAGVNAYENFIVPPSIATKADIARLVNEAERIDNVLTEAAVQAKVGVNEQVVPKTTTSFSDFLSHNKLQLGSSHERTELIKQLRLLKETAPTFHVTFAAEADQESLQQITQWFRSSVHPHAVLSVGLQPGLVAGVLLRTANHIYDFSMHGALKSNRGLLVQQLEALRASS